MISCVCSLLYVKIRHLSCEIEHFVETLCKPRVTIARVRGGVRYVLRSMMGPLVVDLFPSALPFFSPFFIAPGDREAMVGYAHRYQKVQQGGECCCSRWRKRCSCCYGLFCLPYITEESTLTSDNTHPHEHTQ